MTARATVLFDKNHKIWPSSIKRPQIYFEQRYANIDLRGPIEIAADSHWGYFVTVITRSHEIGEGGFQTRRADRPVVVKSGAWIGSRALLYNCIIGEGSVVAAGAVVRTCEVRPGVVVAGNPAQVVARWDDEAGDWDWGGQKWTVLK